MNSAVMNFSQLLYLQVVHFLQLFSIRKDNRRAVLANPLLIFIVVIAVIFIAWALGEAICWWHGRSHFIFSSKIRSGEFLMGCK